MRQVYKTKTITTNKNYKDYSKNRFPASLIGHHQINDGYDKGYPFFLIYGNDG